MQLTRYILQQLFFLTILLVTVGFPHFHNKNGSSIVLQLDTLIEFQVENLNVIQFEVHSS